MKAFADLFKRYRLKAGFATLSDFGLALAERGLIYDDSIFSHWQNGSRLPKRDIAIKLLKIFVEYDAIRSLQEANEFLESARLGYLTKREAEYVNEDFIEEITPVIDLQQHNIFVSTTDTLSMIQTLIQKAFANYYNGKLQESLAMTTAIIEYINLIKHRANSYSRTRLLEYYAHCIYLNCRCNFFLYKQNKFTFRTVQTTCSEIMQINKELKRPELYAMAESLLGTAYYLYGRMLHDTSRRRYLIRAISHSKKALGFFPKNHKVYIQSLRTIAASVSMLEDKEAIKQTWNEIDSLIKQQPQENYVMMQMLCGTITVGAAGILKLDNPFRLKEKSLRWFDKGLYGHGAFEISDIKFELMTLKLLNSSEQRYILQLISRGKWIAEIENYVNHSLYFKKFEREYFF